MDEGEGKQKEKQIEEEGAREGGAEWGGRERRRASTGRGGSPFFIFFISFIFFPHSYILN